MTYIQARLDIENKRQPKSQMDSMCALHWVVLFNDNTQNVIVCYDARDPVTCLTSIKDKHPDYEYITCKGMPTAGAAADWAKAFRLVANLTPELRGMLAAGRAASGAPTAPTVTP